MDDCVCVWVLLVCLCIQMLNILPCLFVASRDVGEQLQASSGDAAAGKARAKSTTDPVKLQHHAAQIKEFQTAVADCFQAGRISPELQLMPTQLVHAAVEFLRLLKYTAALWCSINRHMLRVQHNTIGFWTIILWTCRSVVTLHDVCNHASTVL